MVHLETNPLRLILEPLSTFFGLISQNGRILLRYKILKIICYYFNNTSACNLF